MVVDVTMKYPHHNIAQWGMHVAPGLVCWRQGSRAWGRGIPADATGGRRPIPPGGGLPRVSRGAALAAGGRVSGRQGPGGLADDPGSRRVRRVPRAAGAHRGHDLSPDAQAVAPVVPSEGVADEPDIWRPCEGAATSTRRGAFSPGWDVAPHGAPGEGAPRT